MITWTLSPGRDPEISGWAGHREITLHFQTTDVLPLADVGRSAWTERFLSLVRPAFLASDAFRAYRDLQAKLTEAQREIEALRRSRARLEIDRQDAFATLAGLALVKRLSAVEGEVGRIDGELSSSEAGFGYLEQRIGEARQGAEAELRRLARAAVGPADQFLRQQRDEALAAIVGAIGEHLTAIECSATALHLLSGDSWQWQTAKHLLAEPADPSISSPETCRQLEAALASV